MQAVRQVFIPVGRQCTIRARQQQLINLWFGPIFDPCHLKKSPRKNVCNQTDPMKQQEVILLRGGVGTSTRFIVLYWSTTTTSCSFEGKKNMKSTSFSLALIGRYHTQKKWELWPCNLPYYDRVCWLIFFFTKVTHSSTRGVCTVQCMGPIIYFFEERPPPVKNFFEGRLPLRLW